MTSERSTVSRATAVFLPPIGALVLALVYMHWQGQQAREAAASLCARFKPGDSVMAFKQAAIQSKFSVNDHGPTGLTVGASKVVHRIERETYRCDATHDGAVILALKTSVETE